MNADETEIYEFLKQYPLCFVSVIEVSKRIGTRRRFAYDRTWARPILRRMEMDGYLESNPSGEYRIKNYEEDTTTFLRALENPGMSLGDTTIICLDDVSETERRKKGAA